jgi:hypothetical protein
MAPNCYRTLYDIKNHPYLNRTSSEIKEKEAECVSIVDNICSDIVIESTSTSPAVTSATSPTSSISTISETRQSTQIASTSNEPRTSTTTTTSSLLQNFETTPQNRNDSDTLLITTIVFASLTLVLVVLIVLLSFRNKTLFKHKNINMQKNQENVETTMI